MLINEFKLKGLQNELQNQRINIAGNNLAPAEIPAKDPVRNSSGRTFAEVLAQVAENSAGTASPRNIEFSGHALKRIDSRNIALTETEIERLNKGVSMAAEKGSNDALVLVDETAFLVSVRNNRVITTLTAGDIKGNVFTNIDSTVII